MVWELYKRTKKRFTTLKKHEIGIAIAFSIFVLFIFFNFIKTNEQKWQRIAVKVQGKNWIDDYSNGESFRPPLWVADQLEAGLIEYNLSGQKIAEIESVNKYDDGGTILLIINTNVSEDKKTNQLQYKNQPLQVGSKIDFKFNNTTVPGQIIDLNPTPGGYETKEFIVEGRAITDNFIADVIKPGDLSYDLGNNTVIAEVLDIKKERISSNLLSTNGILHIDKNTSEINIKLKITAQNIQENWYFSTEQKIKIGNFLFIAFENYNLQWITIKNFEAIP